MQLCCQFSNMDSIIINIISKVNYSDTFNCIIRSNICGETSFMRCFATILSRSEVYIFWRTLNNVTIIKGAVLNTFLCKYYWLLEILARKDRKPSWTRQIHYRQKTLETSTHHAKFTGQLCSLARYKAAQLCQTDNIRSQNCLTCFDIQ